MYSLLLYSCHWDCSRHLFYLVSSVLSYFGTNNKVNLSYYAGYTTSTMFTVWTCYWCKFGLACANPYDHLLSYCLSNSKGKLHNDCTLAEREWIWKICLVINFLQKRHTDLLFWLTLFLLVNLTPYEFL